MRPQRNFRRPLHGNGRHNAVRPNGRYRTAPPNGMHRTERPHGSVLAAIRASVRGAQGVLPPGEVAYVSHNQFQDFAISQILKDNIASKGYTTPTPIQDQAIPVILAGRDLIGIANTGTGKTAAFLIPLIEKITRDRNQRVLIVTPTRELALQIGEELRDFSRGLGIRWAMIIGGVSVWRQKQDIRALAHVVIGTPGRLKDMIREGVLTLSGFRNVVLDEADRMVDIGFVGDIKYFISLLPKERQSLFFSATVSGRVSEILSQFVRSPVTVSVKKQDTVVGVTQRIIEVTNGKKKIEYLHDLLIQKGFDKVLIFGRTKWGVERLAVELVSRGFKAAAIHGNKRQSQRQRTLTQFRNNDIQILLATDVASRGLDIDNVSHVINYDMPQSYDDYVHRIGRTARANKTGAALTFVD
ncbi:DEAD/DEAH box helicase [Candidatus Gottesmanbacteria bacterium]|nr:DEAD/DEAH box helicase [Candidatus Gottesmanbacteria bacterium]